MIEVDPYEYGIDPLKILTKYELWSIKDHLNDVPFVIQVIEAKFQSLRATPEDLHAMYSIYKSGGMLQIEVFTAKTFWKYLDGGPEVKLQELADRHGTKLEYIKELVRLWRTYEWYEFETYFNQVSKENDDTSTANTTGV